LPGPNGLTELEAAHTPNLDRLAVEGISGLSYPISPGITPGSGPGHLGLFGYEPLAWNIGRGVLEALGIDFKLGPDDLAARGNFCTVDQATGFITDRRAGRIATEVCVRLVKKLRQIRLPGVEARGAGEGYRLCSCCRHSPTALRRLIRRSPRTAGGGGRPEAEAAAPLNRWIAEARVLLADEHPANSLTCQPGEVHDP
jgi:2,3-bisphosphoglycerate-independent phosphoglycerate mutase